MSALLAHLPVLPVVVPFAAGTLMLLLKEQRRRLRLTLALGSAIVQVGVAATLLALVGGAVPEAGVPEPGSAGIGVYRVGGWAAPFGIVLVVDRLSALMLALAAAVGLTSIVYAAGRWDRPGQPLHSLLQFLWVGVNGAFLTGDVFNLFVFFEILLAASYGLVLRGLGAQRVGTGLNYVAVNLASSVLFLMGVALIYAVTGTLNMADLTRAVPALSPADRPIFDVGAALLGVAFLVKAGSWPLNFWLPATYGITVPPVAASFAIMTKVGVYALLRVGTLMGEDEAAAAILGRILFWIGLATLVAGIVGTLSARRLARLVAYSVVVSSGLLLTAFGLGLAELIAPALFYLATSVLTTAAFFMVAGMTERTALSYAAADAHPAESEPFYQAYGVVVPDPYDISEEVGTPIPLGMAFLGLVFVCCVLLVAGLPPLPGFIAKVALLSTAIGSGDAPRGAVWLFTVAVIVSGFAAVFAASRLGMRVFWSSGARHVPRPEVLQASAVASLVIATFAIAVWAPEVMRFMEATTASLLEPAAYVRGVLSDGGGAP
ncbi:MAG TPA: monovalent cation/H+ antiporter subunit D [Longimicrobiales bacterium]|nr:monovalent cation/H+ antiporter subunit D [Longimicrobiales bacterium]